MQLLSPVFIYLRYIFSFFFLFLCGLLLFLPPEDSWTRHWTFALPEKVAIGTVGLMVYLSLEVGIGQLEMALKKERSVGHVIRLGH